MDERHSTLPSIVWVVQPLAVQPQAVAGAAVRAAQAAGVVPEPPVPEVLEVLQFRLSPERVNPVRALRLLPVLKRPAGPEGKVAAEALVGVGVAVLLRRDAAAVAPLVAEARVVVPSIRFRARRSSTCCWRPEST